MRQRGGDAAVEEQQRPIDLGRTDRQGLKARTPSILEGLCIDGRLAERLHGRLERCFDAIDPQVLEEAAHPMAQEHLPRRLRDGRNGRRGHGGRRGG